MFFTAQPMTATEAFEYATLEARTPRGPGKISSEEKPSNEKRCSRSGN